MDFCLMCVNNLGPLLQGTLNMMWIICMATIDFHLSVTCIQQLILLALKSLILRFFVG